MATTVLSQISEMSLAERIQLVQDIWDGIAADEESLPLTAEDRAELDRRLEAHDADPHRGADWLEVRSRIAQPR
jgi:putative addiction module component (TIGR02574 family)